MSDTRPAAGGCHRRSFLQAGAAGLSTLALANLPAGAAPRPQGQNSPPGQNKPPEQPPPCPQHPKNGHPCKP